MPQVNFAIGLPPKRALEWFGKKESDIRNYRELTAAEHGKAFTVAGITQLDLLNNLKQSIQQSMADGTPYSKWKDSALDVLRRHGWVNKDNIIYDESSGEFFGTPNRLERIYRTNVQSAYSAQRYQTHMDNVDNRPYWRYNAVNDDRTRPAHSALSGRIYRYDDPFWSVHYPPNGYNCRCSVQALAERDIERGNLTVARTDEADVIEYEMTTPKGKPRRVRAVKIDGIVRAPDVGFDYNPGRQNYWPRLDEYDRALAHEFCKREMTGAEFKRKYQLFAEALPIIRQQKGIDSKASKKQLVEIRKRLASQSNFICGVVSEDIQSLIDAPTCTVWLSDDTLAKQAQSREHQGFDVSDYAFLPDLIHSPEIIAPDRPNEFELIKGDYRAVIKILEAPREIFLLSFRRTNKKKIEKAQKNALR